MSDTPRTDALDAKHDVTDARVGDAQHYRQLARTLERELAGVRKAAKQARDVLDNTRQTFGINLPATFEAIAAIDKSLREGDAL